MKPGREVRERERERDGKEFAQKTLNEINKDDFIFLPRND